jgi:hypothetical protein
VTRRAPDRRPRLVALAAMLLLGLGVSSGLAGTVRAADPPTMTARVLLQGHARLGSWIAIEVHLVNSGPSISGELRLQGGSQGGTRYSTAVQLDSPSDKTWVLHAQPPSFGKQLEVTLVSGGQTLLRQKVAVSLHDPGQLIVGVVAENARGVVGSLNLPGAQNQQPSVVVPLAIADLPRRIEAWSAMDRLVWQDVDSSSLDREQLAALRGWLALGGRLVIVGGTAGIGALGGFPDDLLPYRPASTVDVAPAALSSLLGVPPKGATDVPAMAGELTRGRSLATSGDLVVAAEASYGTGSVTILGLDPTTGWIAESTAGRSLWPGLIPARADGSVAIGDDGQIVSAVSNLPSLALPPVGGLLLLLLGYVALIGPINYVVLRRLDRREWAWVTMPVLIAGFAVGAYAFGSALRGSSVIVNEIAIVRGAPDATEGSAQVYFGVFSPARGTYQVAIPGGALLSSPISGDVFGGSTASLDVLQGDPSRVRDLSVGFGSLRTIRAESQATVPKVHAELALVDGKLTGFVRNDSDRVLEHTAIVLGSNVKTLSDLQPGQQASVALALVGTNSGPSLSDKLFGQLYFDGSTTTSETMRRAQTRHLVIDQLTFDPQFGSTPGLSSETPVLLAWGRERVLDVSVEGQAPNRVSNALYYVPLGMTVRGNVVFKGDLIRSTMTASDAAFFSKDPRQLMFGTGSVTMAYRPIAFTGTLTPSHVRLTISCCGEGGIRDIGGIEIEPVPPVCVPDPADVKPAPSAPAFCPAPKPPEQFDGLPELELFDRTGKGSWQRLPHLNENAVYDVADPARYVDPATGAILVRLVNERQDQVNAFVSVSIEGTVK